MFNTSLEYSGNIEFYLNIKNKQIKLPVHNVGTQILHQSICRFLAGQYRGLCDVPNYIDIRNSTTNKSILSSVIPLSGRLYKIEYNDCYVQCDAAIAYQQIIIPIDSEDQTEYKLVLCADKDPDIYGGTYRDLAYVTLEASNLSSIMPGTSGAVQWRLHVKNAQIGEQT